MQLATLAALSDGKGTLKDATLRKELKNNLSGVTDNNITGNEKNGWQVKIDKRAYYINPKGETGEAFWEEVKDENGDIEEIRRADGLVTGLKIGDTINYVATSGLDTTNDAQMQITSSQTINGAVDQTVDLRNYTGTWRLLGVENGRLNVISSKNVGVVSTDSDTESSGVYASAYLKLKGRIGYPNAEEEINRICGVYGKGTNALGARSITVEDINKITGYDPEHTGVNVNKATAEQIAQGTKYGVGQLYQYGNRVTYEWDGTANEPYKPKYTSSVVIGQLSQTHNWSTFKGFSWFDGKAWQKSDYVEGKTGKICELTSNYYNYYPETLTATNNTEEAVGIANNSPERDLLFNQANLETRTNEEYWLASRCVYTRLDYVDFVVRGVRSCRVASRGLASSSGYENSNGLGLRPIVTLKSDIQLKKDGSGVWQFLE